ncbi:unnamed protein product [Diamesa tonsa]
MRPMCVVCKSIDHGYYYFAIHNDDFANEVRARAKAKLSKYPSLKTCEPCIELVRQTLVAKGKNYQTCPKEMLESRILFMGNDFIDPSTITALPKSIYDDTITQPLQQQVESPLDFNAQISSNASIPTNTSSSSIASIPSNTSLDEFAIPKRRHLELDIRKRPMPFSVKRRLLQEEIRQKYAKVKFREANSSSSSSKNSQLSRQFGYSDSFTTGKQITSTQNEHNSEPIRANNLSSLSSLEGALSESSYNRINSQQSRLPNSLQSIDVPLTNQPNTESIEVPLSDRVVVQLSDLAGVSTQRGHMRIRRRSSEISNSSGFIPLNNDVILSGNSSSYLRSSLNGRQHSNVAAPSRISEYLN